MDDRQTIIDFVTDRQGCKLTELVAALPLVATPDVIDSIISDDQLVEVEYVLPSMPERVKSFLLPRGTGVYVTDRSVPTHLDAGGNVPLTDRERRAWRGGIHDADVEVHD